ncbi:hypothetical protein I4F81_007526 [Pyropia yezoensis]|uniref:Uncharacterized protein n=1 Tax=Pyropia yezoensis TaxID=2788 RepID=A0ACC3C468_PYRYE|nr:hypothetical protein I4F81_007526 [Neopyropia yezoensis]
MLDHGDGVSWGDGAADEAATTPRGDDADATVPISAYHLRKVPLSGIAQRPGLVSIAEALELPEDARVRACSRLSFVALFEYGWKAEQLLYTSHSFRGKPWYALVLYSHPEDASTISVAEVRAIVRRPEGDVAVIPDIFVVPGVDNCPLVARGCTRMAGIVLSGDTDVRLRALPVACVRRVVHEVPDFADLVHCPQLLLLRERGDEPGRRRSADGLRPTVENWPMRGEPGASVARLLRCPEFV